MKFGTQMQIWNLVTVTQSNIIFFLTQGVRRLPYWKSFFGHNSAADCSISVRFCTDKQKSTQHGDRGHVTKYRFHNSKWRSGAILKIVKWPYLNEKSSDCDEIWFITAYWWQPCDRIWKIFKFNMADGRHIENRFFGHMSAAESPRFQWNIAQRSWIAWRSRLRQTLNFENLTWWMAVILKIIKSPMAMKIHSILMKVGTQQQIWNSVTVGWTKCKNSCKFKMADGRHIVNRCWL